MLFLPKAGHGLIILKNKKTGPWGRLWFIGKYFCTLSDISFPQTKTDPIGKPGKIKIVAVVDLQFHFHT